VASASLTRKKRFLRKYISEGGIIPCYLCGETLTLKTATLDHVIPRSKGGVNHADNIRFCCESCNNKKQNNIPKIVPPRWIKP